MSKKILLLILLGVLILPSFASAEVTVKTMVCAAISTTWIIAVGVVIILWIVTGILFLIAQGNPAKLTAARTALITSIAGTVLVILAFFLFQKDIVVIITLQSWNKKITKLKNVRDA